MWGMKGLTGDSLSFCVANSPSLFINIINNFSYININWTRINTAATTNTTKCTELLWESYRDGNMEIYAAGVDGSNLRNLSQDDYADDHGPTSSPWGDRIAFFTNRDRGWDICTLDLATGERANLTLSPMIEQSPFWGR